VAIPPTSTKLHLPSVEPKAPTGLENPAVTF
jgi:hypothetical protein